MKKVLFIAVIALLAASCDNTWIEEVSTQESLEMFQLMWNDIDDHYVFFDQKEVNWSEVKARYESEITADMGNEELFDLFAGALAELKDGHVSLYAGFNTWNYYDLFLDHTSNFNMAFIERNYLQRVNTIGPFVYDMIAPEVGYIYYESFGDNFTNEQLDYLFNDYFSETNGIVIDMRDNLGGAADNVIQLMAAFVMEDFLAGKTYTPDMGGGYVGDDVYVKVQDEYEQYSGEIVLLTNRQCYSSCNVFAGFMSQLENVTIVGDTTGGGSGLAVASELPNGWKYRYSAAKITLADNTEIENGVSPDIAVTTGPDEELAGVDLLLDEAIRLVQDMKK